jgi:hypothetical protein
VGERATHTTLLYSERLPVILPVLRSGFILVLLSLKLNYLEVISNGEGVRDKGLK